MNASRRTSQPLLTRGTALRRDARSYRLFPLNEIGGDGIERGYDALARAVAGHPRVLIDGFSGVRWTVFRDRLDASLRGLGLQPRWLSVEPDPRRLSACASASLFDGDPLFGHICRDELRAMFDPALIETAGGETSDGASAPVVIYGHGAALCGQGFLVHVDVPKNEIQYRSRAGAVTNLGVDRPLPPKEAYRRFYYLDWPMLEAHRGALAERIDLFVDGQDEDAPSFARGDTVRDGVSRLARHVFRLRPWFESGAWGGQWLRENVAGVATDVPNYAWSFEMITPENGIVLSDGYDVLELGFDLMMRLQARQVLGARGRRFGHFFPVRINFLDTVRGGNLSIQCHPSDAYARQAFGEPIGQHETYYIAECEPDARVYLGLRDDADPAAFRAALERSAATGDLVDIDRFVNSVPSERGTLHLIPSGAVHSAGRGNVVVEISSTPYLYTFKLYDWLRADLDGTPRPLNIDRGFECLDPTLRGRDARLVATETCCDAGDGWRRTSFSMSPSHPHEIGRLHVDAGAVVALVTDGSFLLCNTVEGGPVEIRTEFGTATFNHLETFCIPAATKTFHLRSIDGPATLLLAWLKPEAEP